MFWSEGRDGVVTLLVSVRMVIRSTSLCVSVEKPGVEGLHNCIDGWYRNFKRRETHRYRGGSRPEITDE